MISNQRHLEPAMKDWVLFPKSSMIGNCQVPKVGDWDSSVRMLTST